MSLQLLARSVALATNLSVPLGASGGTPPYSFGILSGGGSINSSTGQFVTPGVSSSVTVQVADSLGEVATLKFMVGSALELVCDIIQNGLGLPPGQVYLWDQKFNIPNDSKLYIAVGILTCKPFGNSNKLDSNGNQVQSVNMSVGLSIDIMSRSLIAVNRKEEVLMALNSSYSESQQEINSFRIFPLTTNLVNLADEEGAAILYRFNFTVNMQYFVMKTGAVPYYDDFENPPTVVTEP